jgi:hypothetical protein
MQQEITLRPVESTSDQFVSNANTKEDSKSSDIKNSNDQTPNPEDP